MFADLLGGIQEQLYRTIVLFIEFFKGFNVWVALGTLACLYVIFMRTWEFRKIGSLFLTWFFLLIAYVRLDAFFGVAPFSPEGIDMAQMVLRIMSGIIAAIVFVYHAVVAQ